jgi:hypothetical protein
LTIGTRSLPNRVGEVGNSRNVPDASAIDAVTTNAVTIEEAHDNAFLFLRASQPIPGPAWFVGEEIALHDPTGSHVAVVALVAM